MEEDNEWETIQPSSTSATQSDEDDGDTVVIAAPTDSHQISPVSPQPVPQPSSPTPSLSSSSSSNSTEGEFPQPQSPAREVRVTVLDTSLKILRGWVLRVCYGIRSGIGLWSVAAFVTATAFAWRWRRWRRLVERDNRDKMALLINQKDEKIKQLQFQIERMNEALLGRRRVPVLRVVVDKPLVVGPRSNWKPT